MAKRQTTKRKKSFSLDPAGEASLSVQLADRLRQMIARGEYESGDVLPGVRDLAELCGTSTRVPMAAFAALVSEGLVKPRPRVGCVVLGKNRKVWKGRVVIIRTSVSVTYSVMAFREELAAQLMHADWRVEFLSMTYERDKVTPELKPLKRLLSERIDLVVLLGGDLRIVSLIEAAGVPFLTLDGEPKLSDNHVGRSVQVWRGAVLQFARECTRHGVKRLLRVCLPNHSIDEYGDLHKSGVAVEDLVVPQVRDETMQECLRRDGYRALDERLKGGRRNLPDLIFFADDYLAQGGLLALARAGLWAPGDVWVVTLANAGLQPVYPRSLTRFEVDQKAHARKFAAAVLRFLERGVRPETIFQSVQYVPGETF